MSKYLFIVLLPTGFLFGQSVSINKNTNNLDIGTYTYYLEDEPGSLKIEDILLLKDQFQRTEQDAPNFSSTGSAYWVKFSVQNLVDDNYYLEVGSAFLDSVSLYQLDKGQLDYAKHTGDDTPFNSREVHAGNYLFELEIPVGEVRDYFLRVKSTQPLFFPLRIGTYESFIKSGHERDFFQGMYFGFMLLMFLYNLFLYITIKERVYLFYIGYVISITWFMASVFGYFFEFLWPNTPIINQYVVVSSGLTIITATLFTQQFLNLKELNKKWHFGTNVFVTIGVLVCVLIALDLKIIGLQLAQGGLLLMSIYFLFLGIFSYRKGFGPAKYYLVAWGSLATGIILAILESLNVVPVLHSINAMQLGSGLEVLLLSFALGDRINTYKRQREEAQELALQKAREHEELVLLQNLTLEQKVDERTKELREERDKLDAANKTKSRFFSIISHDLRSPMSVMYGFSQLLKSHIQKAYGIKEDKRMDELMDYLNASSNQVFQLLDSLLKWAMKEEGVMPYNPELTILKELIDENIQNANPQAIAKSIVLEVSAVQDHVVAWVDKNSFGTVLRNLTNNSLKFTPEGGKIIFSFYKDQGDEIVLKISDTGIGIPEEKLTDLFEINDTKVRRGTDGEKGSGLGLNLVYDFVKMNKGEITVKSQVGQGTSFIIKLPAPIEEQSQLSIEETIH